MTLQKRNQQLDENKTSLVCLGQSADFSDLQTGLPSYMTVLDFYVEHWIKRLTPRSYGPCVIMRNSCRHKTWSEI